MAPHSSLLGLDGYETGIGTREQSNVAGMISSRKPKPAGKKRKGSGGLPGVYLEPLGRSVPSPIAETLLGSRAMRPKVMCDDERCCPDGAGSTLDHRAPHAVRTRARPPGTTLMPGVTYGRQVELTSHGPVAIHVLTAPRPGGLYSLAPTLSNGAVAGREPLTALERRASATATVAGVNGDFFAASGEPSGIVMRGGVLDHPPRPDRSSIGVAADGSLRVEPVVYN